MPGPPAAQRRPGLRGRGGPSQGGLAALLPSAARDRGDPFDPTEYGYPDGTPALNADGTPAALPDAGPGPWDRRQANGNRPYDIADAVPEYTPPAPEPEWQSPPAPEPVPAREPMWVHLPWELAPYFSMGFTHTDDVCPVIVLQVRDDGDLNKQAEVRGSAEEFMPLLTALAGLIHHVPCMGHRPNARHPEMA